MNPISQSMIDISPKQLQHLASPQIVQQHNCQSYKTVDHVFRVELKDLYQCPIYQWKKHVGCQQLSNKHRRGMVGGGEEGALVVDVGQQQRQRCLR